MSSVFDEVSEQVKETLKAWPEIIKFLQTVEGPSGERFNQEEVVPGTDVELWWFDERVTSVCGLVAGLSEYDSDGGAPIPLETLSSMEITSSHLHNTVEDIRTAASEAKTRGLDSLNPENWILVIKGTGQETNIASLLQNLSKYLESLLKQYISIAVVVTANGFTGFSEAIREFSELAEKIRNDASAAEKAGNQAQHASNDIGRLKDAAESERAAVSKALENANEVLTKTDAINQKGETQLSKVSEIASQAETLRTKVQEYQAQFDGFQEKLKNRNAAFDEWTANVERLFNDLSQKNDDIGVTIRRANEMLAGSTNAGLAGTFKENLDDLDIKLKDAQDQFNQAIWFVFGSALPLTIYVITATVLAINPELGNPITADGESGFWNNLLNTVKSDGLTLSATLALFLVMVPSIWRTKFAVARYNQLFQLREHYQYKYSIAMSVEGFKLQAPEHEQEIAAETFNRLLFNPTDRLAGSDSLESHPSPLMNYLMNKLGFNSKGEEK